MLNGVVKIKSLADMGLEGDIPETADTLQGNALQKAQWVWERTHMDCFADDTGLEVEALNGAPGVYSARYAGEHCSFDDNIDKLLAALDGNTNRRADFRTVICLIEQGVPRYFEGRVDGVILTERYGRPNQPPRPCRETADRISERKFSILNSQFSILKMSYTQVYPLQISQSMSMSGAYVLVLDAPENGKQVPIIIGEAEAQAIVMAIEQKQARRPLTHNLLNNILEEYLLVLKQVTIDRFEEGIFYSTLYISDGFSEKRIDSRTSDAIVLALLQHCNIMIENRVLEETSMEPGALENNLPQNRSKSQSETLTLEQLEDLLHECEEKEDYEQAAEIMEKINRMKNEGLES